jgi:predicted NUDIX family NTP pyrophosphohydrolase
MRRSAGIIPYRLANGLEVLIAHPGGPLFARRDAGWWSIVKGEIHPGEPPLEAARREFAEETGWEAPDGPFVELGEARQKGGKIVSAWATEADHDPDRLDPGTFEMLWMGSLRSFPEIDRVQWTDAGAATRLLNPAQVVFVDRLATALTTL